MTWETMTTFSQAYEDRFLGKWAWRNISPAKFAALP
jgi:hypothetical protein